MKIIQYAAPSFEPWDWRNPDRYGIGGSETCYIETALRLARRGHEVVCYAPIPDDCQGQWRGTTWRHSVDLNTAEPCDLWIIHRSPGMADKFENNQRLWHVSQDVVYWDGVGGAYTEERCRKFERILALCVEHRDYLASAFPFLNGNLCISSNGIKSDEIEQDPEVPRDPKRLIWASSPDRGLEALLHIFKRAYEHDGGLSLHCYYGFDNWDRYIAKHPGCPQEKMKATIVSLLDQPGVRWHGRINQRDLRIEFRRSGLWVYPTEFSETSCISVMEAQALGAIPITNPFWAMLDNVGHGILIHGSPSGDPLTRARYVGAILRLAQNPGLQDQIRAEMTPWAKERFDWEKVVDQWEAWMRHADV